MRGVAVLIVALVLVVGACGSAASVPPVGSTPASSAVASSGAEPVDQSGCGDTFTHQAPDIEAALPKRVAGRDLTVWSSVGACLVKGLTYDDAAGYDKFVKLASEKGVELSELRQGMAGRFDPTDPPYFVMGVSRPASAAADELAVALLQATGGFVDPAVNYSEIKTIAGREVYVGTTEMLVQNEHQRGRPYLVATPRFYFLVVTGEPAWAEEAIAQLPM